MAGRPGRDVQHGGGELTRAPARRSRESRAAARGYAPPRGTRLAIVDQNRQVELQKDCCTTIDA